MSAYAKKPRHGKSYKSKVLKRFDMRKSTVPKSYSRQLTTVPAMYNPVPRNLHNIVAPRFFTNLEYGFTGQLAGAAGYHFTVLGNGLALPGNTANVFTGAGGTLFPSTVTLAALNPVGFSQLGGLYKAYRVWSSTITVSGFPESFCGFGVVFPTSTEASLADPQLAQSLPYSKMKILTSTGNSADNTITSLMDTKTMYGLSQSQMKAAVEYSGTSSSNPSNSWWWNILLSSTVNAARTFDVVLRVNYVIEYFDPLGNEIDT